MNKRILSAVGLVLSLGVSGWSQISLAEQRTITVAGSPRTITSKLSRLNPNTTRVRAIMNLNFTFGYHHNTGKPVIEAMLTRFASQEGWTLTHFRYQDPNNTTVNDLARVTLAELNKNIVVVANHISYWATVGQTTAPALNAAVTNYMSAANGGLGGGLLLIHGSGDSPAGGGWAYYYSDLHPSQFSGHGSIIPGQIFRPTSAATHPIMEGNILAARQTINGEWHRFAVLITAVKPLTEVLMMVDPANCAGCYPAQYVYAGGNPISWYLPTGNGRGRVGYFQEGHDQTTYNELTPAVWDRFFKQMIFYTAGYDTSGVTGVAPRPDYARSYSGISFNPQTIGVYVEGKHSVQVINSAGKVVMKNGHTQSNEYNFSQELNSAPGLYILRVSNAKGTSSRKYLVN